MENKIKNTRGIMMVFVLSQFIEYSIKIETLKMEILIDCEGGHGCS
jgi:hypothetical protein